MAPRQSDLGRAFQQLRKELKEVTNGQVNLKMYDGGVAGDEMTVVRKMRVGQLDGALLTSTGLGALVPQVLVLQAPGLITSYPALDDVREKLGPDLVALFDKAGYELISWGDSGQVRIFSKHKIQHPNDLRNVRPWVWRGSPTMKAFIEAAGANGVTMGLPEVFSALQTGMVDTVIASSIGVLAFQWHTKLATMTKPGGGIVVGAYVIKKDRLAALPKAAQDHIRQSAKDHAQGVSRGWTAPRRRSKRRPRRSTQGREHLAQQGRLGGGPARRAQLAGRKALLEVVDDAGARDRGQELLRNKMLRLICRRSLLLSASAFGCARGTETGGGGGTHRVRTRADLHCVLCVGRGRMRGCRSRALRTDAEQGCERRLRRAGTVGGAVSPRSRRRFECAAELDCQGIVDQADKVNLDAYPCRLELEIDAAVRSVPSDEKGHPARWAPFSESSAMRWLLQRRCSEAPSTRRTTGVQSLSQRQSMQAGDVGSR